MYVSILQDLIDGPYTLKLQISKADLLNGEEFVIGLLPIQIGQVLPGDSELDWDVDLVDTVVAMRFVDSVATPNDLQLRATNLDTNPGVQLGDVFQIFKLVFASFWQVS